MDVWLNLLIYILLGEKTFQVFQSILMILNKGGLFQTIFRLIYLQLISHNSRTFQVSVECY